MDLTSGSSAFEATHFSLASHLLSPLAEAGHPDVQSRIAVMAQNGLGMAPNEFMAYTYMLGAPESGFALAQHGLGFVHLEGECVEKKRG